LLFRVTSASTYTFTMILKQCAKFQSNVLMDFETSMELKETLTVGYICSKNIWDS